VKVALLCFSLLLAASLTSCTTIENRRDMFCGYGKVHGPYTSGAWQEKTTVTVTESQDYKGIVK